MRRAALALCLLISACANLSNPSETAHSPCEAEKWAVTPTQIFTLPGAGGFKHVHVLLAVENNSRYWGQVEFSPTDPVLQSYLTVTDGSTYPAARQVQLEGDLTDAALLHRWRSIRSQLYTQGLRYIPPGFRLRGEAMIGFDVITEGHGSANTWSQAVYTVAEGQEMQKITIPALTIVCVHSDGQEFEEISGPISLDLEQTVRAPVYPSAEADSEFASITQPITLAGLGRLEFQGAHFKAGMVGIRYLALDFLYMNQGSGEARPARFEPVLVGDDGLSRRITHVYAPPGCSVDGSLAAETGLSISLRLCFYAGNQASSFKLVWIDEENGVFEVYDLPEGF